MNQTEALLAAVPAELHDHPWVLDAIAELKRLAPAASRWEAVKTRHGMKLVQLATGQSGYNSFTKAEVLDAWADKAATDVGAYNPERHHAEAAARISELETPSP